MLTSVFRLLAAFLRVFLGLRNQQQPRDRQRHAGERDRHAGSSKLGKAYLHAPRPRLLDHDDAGKATEQDEVAGKAGAEGKRSALPHGRVMIHQPLGGVQGQASDIEIEAREIQKFKKELYTIISTHAHQSYDKVWQDSDRNYWMTAEEAKEYGMIDAVLTRKNQE